MLSEMLNMLSGRADVARTYTMTPSFAGHMALRCAVDDTRIRGVITAGAPVTYFFTDPALPHALPRLMLDTLAHLTRTPAEEVTGHVSNWALTDAQLAALHIPICYLASRRDEIVPQSDVSHLRHHVRDLRLLENDDFHGAPRRAAETRLWAALSVLRMRGVRSVRRAALGSMWHTLRARQRLARSASWEGL